MTNLEVGDLVLCTVERIEGTVVFVNIDSTGEQGSIITSEIAPGRIRNLREYVVPKKRIVCKVLRVSSEGRNIDLSLRRVSAKEKKEVMDEWREEQNFEGVLKGILKEKAQDIIEKITSESTLLEFFEEAKVNSKELEKLVGKENTLKIVSIVSKQKVKAIVLKKEISLKTTSPNGLELIKKILTIDKENVEVQYIAAGRYVLKLKAPDFKQGNTQVQKIVQEMEEQAKKENLEISIKDSKK